MPEMMKARCIYCGGDVYYQGGEQLIKCEWCGQTLVTAKFEHELARMKKTEEENAQIKEKLAQAEKEKQAADDRLFAALSNLDSLGEAQGELADLLSVMKVDAVEQTDVLTFLLKTLLSGQKDAASQLQLLRYVSDRLVQSQDDILTKVQTQSEIIGQLYQMEMDAGERQKLASDFMLWMQESHAEDAEKFRQIGEASAALLQEQIQIGENVDQLRMEASAISQSLKEFEDKWENAKLEELVQTYHQAENYQHDRAFDKAEKYYRQVLIKGGEDAEVYWRLLMCHYCLSYQKDDEGRQIPIILNPDLTDPAEMSIRSELTQHLTDQNRRHYQKQLEKIDRILDKYRLLKDQIRYDVFISVKQNKDGHYTSDSDVAADLYDFLTDQGMRVFNSRRSTIPAGQEYEPYIISALMSAKAMIVVGTSPENMNSQWVKNEWSRFQWLQRSEKEKTGKTDRILICYLAKGMQAKEIPKALNPSRQAIFDGVKAHDELMESLSFLLKKKTARVIPEKTEPDFKVIRTQMQFWLLHKNYKKVLEKYDALTDAGRFLTHAQLHLMALCARRQVPSIRNIVQSQIILEEEIDYITAAVLCESEDEKRQLRELKEQNRQWRKQQAEHAAAKEKAPVQEQGKTGKTASKPELIAQDHKEETGDESAQRQEQVARMLQRMYQLRAEKEEKENAQKRDLLTRLILILDYAGNEKKKEAKQAEVKKEDPVIAWWEQGLKAEAGNDYEMALRCFYEAAIRGHVWAQYKTGIYLETGQGTQIDRKKAVDWYWKAADQGLVEAQYKIAAMCYLGSGVPKDQEEAVRWFQKAADQGHAGAANWLKEIRKEKSKKPKQKQENKPSAQALYKTGMSYKQMANYQEAVKYFTEAAEAGNANAQYELALCYQQGKGVDIWAWRAAMWFQKAADQGLVEAQYAYAVHMKEKIGSKNALTKAAVYFRKAANQGHAQAQNQLALCYETGSGLTMNQKKAAEWYKKSAQHGYDWGQYNYAVCLIDGKGIARDPKEAAVWFRKSADQGNSWAQNQLGLCYDSGMGITMDKAAAVKCFEKSARQGYDYGQYNYALFLKDGIGTAKDPVKAIEWFRKAAAQGNSLAQYQLGVLYQMGIGTAKNKDEAIKWFQKAADQGHEDAKKRLDKLTKKKWFF